MVALNMPIFSFLFPTIFYLQISDNNHQCSCISWSCGRVWTPDWCTCTSHFTTPVQEKASPAQQCSGVSGNCMWQLAREDTPAQAAKLSSKTALCCPGKGHRRAFGHNAGRRPVQGRWTNHSGPSQQLHGAAACPTCWAPCPPESAGWVQELCPAWDLAMPYGKSHLVWDIWQDRHLAMPAVGAQALSSVLSEDKEDPQKSLTLLDTWEGLYSYKLRGCWFPEAV